MTDEERYKMLTSKEHQLKMQLEDLRQQGEMVQGELLAVTNERQLLRDRLDAKLIAEAT